jgi:hypothetical protein
MEPAVIAEAAVAPTNGATMAAFLAAGIGSSAMGVLVVLNEAGLFAAPSLYAPAGGLSGRSTFAVGIWLIAWAALHGMWKGRHIEARRVAAATITLVALAVIATFPPLWAVF